jgi:peptidyl-prolyl cis-trans isomerase D
MLDQMRRGVTNIFTKLLLGLLVVAFAVWGIGDMTLRSRDDGTIATVGKTRITAEEFRQTYEEEMQSVAGRLGRRLTPEQAKLVGIHTRALTRLVGFGAIDLNAEELRITVSDQLVGNIIRGDAGFKGLTGQFDRQKFREAISKLGYRSENQYIKDRHRDIVREQLTETIGSGILPSRPVLQAFHSYREETRTAEYLIPDLAKLVKLPDPDDAKLAAFYEENKRKYVALESRKANVLLLSREQGMKRVTITDEELKAAYEAAKDSYSVPEKRRVAQMTFPDMAAAEKAHAELSKAKNFAEAAAKLGFPAKEIDLGLLTRAEMIDPKIADITFGLKKNELSKPIQGAFSIALVRVSDIEAGKQKTLADVTSEIKDRLAGDRVGQVLGDLHDKVEAERAKGRPLREIAAELKLPFLEVPDITRTGGDGAGKTAIEHADAGRMAEAIFAATPGVETEILDLTNGGYAWFDLVGVTPERQRPLEEVKAAVRTDFLEAEKRKEVESLAAKQVERIKNGESMEAVAKELGAKLERAEGLKRTAPSTALPAAALQEIFALPKGGAASVATADGKARIIYRVAEVKAAPPPTPEQLAALSTDVARQMRIDTLEQYVAGLRTRYGFTVNEKAFAQLLTSQSPVPAEGE